MSKLLQPKFFVGNAVEIHGTVSPLDGQRGEITEVKDSGTPQVNIEAGIRETRFTYALRLANGDEIKYLNQDQLTRVE